jgi:hemerythrin
MHLVAWSDKYSVGIESVDSQHFVLFEVLNELNTAMVQGQAHAVSGQLLAKLLKYTRDHFSGEEAIMAASGYPGLEAHKALHRELTHQVEDYIARHRAAEDRAEPAVNPQMLSFLRDWLANHIQTVDREAGPWMNEHGVE